MQIELLNRRLPAACAELANAIFEHIVAFYTLSGNWSVSGN
jgi:hypothetical protein